MAKIFFLMKKRKNLFEIGDEVNYLGNHKYDPYENTKVIYYNDYFGYGIVHPKGVKMKYEALSSCKGWGILESRYGILFVTESELEKKF